MTLRREKNRPLTVALFLVGLAIVADFALDWVNFNLPDQPHFLLSASVTFGSILTGFMATSLSLLVGTKSPVLLRIWESDFNDILVSYYRQTIYAALTFCLVSVCGFFGSILNCIGEKFYFFAWLFVGIYTFVAFYRTAEIGFKAIKATPRKWGSKAKNIPDDD